MCANAQITTLEYQSDTLTGNTTYYNNPIPPDFLTPQQFAASFSSAPFIGTITESLSVIGDNPGASLSGVVNLTGYNGTSINLGVDVSAFGNTPQSLTTYAGASGTIDLIESKGAITGATMDITFSSYHAPTMYLRIGPTGDSFSYIYAGTNGPCTQQGADEPNPCTISASSDSAGVWQVSRVPEIGPASVAGELTLLLAGVAAARPAETGIVAVGDDGLVLAERSAETKRAVREIELLSAWRWPEKTRRPAASCGKPGGSGVPTGTPT